MDKLRKEKNVEKIREGIKDLLDKYGSYINLSSVAMGVRDAAREAPSVVSSF